MFPLEGVRVVEFCEVAAGPFCGMLLADMGADGPDPQTSFEAFRASVRSLQVMPLELLDQQPSPNRIDRG